MAGGSIRDVSIKGREFEVAADADATIMIGGYTNEVAANGGGGARLLKTRQPWKIEGITLSIDHSRGDHEFLQGVVDENDYVDLSITLVDERVFAARGQITGDIGSSTASTTAGVAFSGPGNLSQ